MIIIGIYEYPSSIVSLTLEVTFGLEKKSWKDDLQYTLDGILSSLRRY